MDSYRSILEVLRWSSPKDVLSSAAYISIKWTAPADSQELWSSFCEDALVNTSGCLRAKDAFRICPGFLSPLLPAMRLGCIRLISLSDLTEKPAIQAQNIGITSNTSYCFIDKCTILCCGPGTNSAKVNLITEEITVLTEMREPRARAGMLKHRNRVYVFGGLDASSLLRNIEKFSLTENNWSPVISKLAEGRYAFTPCKYKEKAFLVGSCQPIELFNMNKEECRTLILSLPFWINWSLCGIVDDVLLVLLSDKGLRWTINSTRTSFEDFNFPIVNSIAAPGLVDIEHTFNGFMPDSVTFMSYNWVKSQALRLYFTTGDQEVR